MQKIWWQASETNGLYFEASEVDEWRWVMGALIGISWLLADRYQSLDECQLF